MTFLVLLVDRIHALVAHIAIWKNRTAVVVLGLMAVVMALAVPAPIARGSTVDGASKSVVTSADDIPAGAAPRPADVAASALMEWIDAHPKAKVGDVSADPTGESVTVSWKGPVPKALREVAAAQPAAVRFEAAQFSAAELMKEAERIAVNHRQTVAAVGPRHDYSGLEVELSPSAETNRVQASVEEDSFAPITVTRRRADPVPVSRNADTSPFYGGALIYSTNNWLCSTGVAVSSGGTSGITTASHCGTGTWRAHDNGATLGSRWSGKNSAARDTQVIQTSSAQRAYINAWNSGSSRLVYRAERPGNNTRICSNGGVTGQTCSSVYVRGTNRYVNLDGRTVGPGFWILSEGTCDGIYQCGIIQGGDSGSPANSYASTGQLIMKGLQVAADANQTTAACKGHPSYAVICYGRAFAVNTVDALNTLGVSIKGTG